MCILVIEALNSYAKTEKYQSLFFVMNIESDQIRYVFKMYFNHLN